MSCILRVGGKNFDVDALLAQTQLKPCAVFRKGEPRRASKPQGKVNELSSVNIEISDADFDQLDKQINDAVKFLTKNKGDIQKLVVAAGPDCRPELDFAIERRDVAVQTDYLPPELIMLAGGLGLGISVSQYPGKDG